METLFQNMPGYRMNEYMLVLAPHEDLRKRIQFIKKEFAEKFNCPRAIWGKSHVLLSRFVNAEMMEERIKNRLRIIAMAFHTMKVELRDFGSYPTHSIFIKVVSREPVRELVNEIRSAQILLKLDNDHKPYFTEDLHVNISSKLLPWQYEKAWLEYENHHFTGRFIADSMLLLKRRAGEKPWQILERLEFQNLPVAVKQGELFS
jgi:2'-5' RNA ligase